MKFFCCFLKQFSDHQLKGAPFSVALNITLFLMGGGWGRVLGREGVYHYLIKCETETETSQFIWR